MTSTERTARDGRLGSERQSPRYPDAGRLFHLVLFTERRTGHLRPFPVARALVGALRSVEAEGLSETHAYLVMPDQLQWLLRLGSFAELARTVRLLKQRSERAITARLMLPGPLWAPAWAEVPIDEETDLVARTRSIFGLVDGSGNPDAARHWPHWDCPNGERWLPEGRFDALLQPRSGEAG